MENLQVMTSLRLGELRTWGALSRKKVSFVRRLKVDSGIAVFEPKGLPDYDRCGVTDWFVSP